MHLAHLESLLLGSLQPPRVSDLELLQSRGKRLVRVLQPVLDLSANALCQSATRTTLTNSDARQGCKICTKNRNEVDLSLQHTDSLQIGMMDRPGLAEAVEHVGRDASLPFLVDDGRRVPGHRVHQLQREDLRDATPDSADIRIWKQNDTRLKSSKFFCGLLVSFFRRRS